MANKYRIIKHYDKYQVEIWRWYWPFWKGIRVPPLWVVRNYYSIYEAKKLINDHRNDKLMYVFKEGKELKEFLDE